MIAVLAGSHMQFLEWCRTNRMIPRREARHTDRLASVQGVAFDEFTKYGTWWDAPEEAQQAFRYAVWMRKRYEAQ